MKQVLEEYGGMLTACLAGVCLIAMMLAMGDENGILYEFVVEYCGNAV